jgi:hypothetical protein
VLGSFPVDQDDSLSLDNEGVKQAVEKQRPSRTIICLTDADANRTAN